MEGFDYKCEWCENYAVSSMMFVNRKYRHYPERIKGWVCRDCWSELYDLDCYMQTRKPRIYKKPNFIQVWYAHHRPHNAITDV